jgi:hypothetical protein
MWSSSTCLQIVIPRKNRAASRTKAEHSCQLRLGYRTIYQDGGASLGIPASPNKKSVEVGGEKRGARAGGSSDRSYGLHPPSIDSKDGDRACPATDVNAGAPRIEEHVIRIAARRHLIADGAAAMVQQRKNRRLAEHQCE